MGFGRPDGEYWLGLEPVHQVTSRGDHELLILLEDWGGRGARAHYDSFSLEPESDHYRLRLGQYHGDAGDSLSWHNDKPFSTVDRDRDSYSGKESFCSGGRAGGWSRFSRVELGAVKSFPFREARDGSAAKSTYSSFWVRFTVPTLGRSQQPVTLAPGDPILLASVGTYTRINGVSICGGTGLQSQLREMEA